MASAFVDAPPRRFTADEVLRMVDVGILAEDDRVELLDGKLVQMSPQGAPHSGLTVLVRELLLSLYREAGVTVCIRDHSTVAAGPMSLPEPDLAVVRGAAIEYLTRLPSGEDIILVVEIAKSSRSIDRRKASIYARAGVEHYWLIDLDNRRIEVRQQPSQGEYLSTQIIGVEGEVTLPQTEIVVAVSELVPQAASSPA